jgi:hypothetical protein
MLSLQIEKNQILMFFAFLAKKVKENFLNAGIKTNLF